MKISFWRRDKPESGTEEEILEAPKSIPSTYPRFSYLIEWKYLPEPRRYLKANVIHFSKQLTQREIRQVAGAFSQKDPNFQATMKSVTGKPAHLGLSVLDIQRIPT